ncbi:hypothetical protein D3C72_2096630 [compost metagenome]
MAANCAFVYVAETEYGFESGVALAGTARLAAVAATAALPLASLAATVALTWKPLNTGEL